jgi:glucose/arabinose dehydrogenase
MRFLDANNILVLQKNDGQVRLISNGVLQNKPILQVSNIVTEAERGLLGIAIWNENCSNNNDDEGSSESSTTTWVYLYLTEKEPDGGSSIRNRIYKYSYDWNKRVLENKTLILDLPGEPGPYHNGGKIAISPYDGYLYAVIGDVSSG